MTFKGIIILSVTGEFIDSRDFLSEGLRKRYNALRSTHCTRTDDVGSFYRKGLLPLEPKIMEQRARDIFLSGKFPELTEENMARAVAEVGTETRSGRVYFEANEKLILEHGGHYALYGSEYVIALAAHLGGSRDYRRVLKTLGTPTVFICDVPFSALRDSTLGEFAGEAIADLFEELLPGPEYEPDPWRGAGFSIDGGLAPEHIVGHYHPARVRDPYCR